MFLRCLKESLEYSRSNIEMINLLQIYDEVYAVRQMTTLTIKHQNIGKYEIVSFLIIRKSIFNNINFSKNGR